MSSVQRAPQKTTPDIAVEIARFAATIDATKLAPEVIKSAKTNIFDTLACALAGSSAKAIPEVTSLVREWAGAPQADMFVFGGKYPAHRAAFANGGIAHARDYDDTHDAAILHAGVTAIPAAIAGGQLRGGFSGADLIAAVTAGLELTCRLGIGVQVDIIETGYIYTPLLGHFGATVAAGRAFGLNEAEMLSALGIVYSMVSGNHQVTVDASLMKRLQPGIAAQNAVLAVQMAKKGIKGPHNVFEGVDGFFRVYFHNRVKPEVVVENLGQRFEFMNLSYKPYPCCRDTHAPIDAALILREKTKRKAQDIERIRVGVTGPGYQMVCAPEHVRLNPKTIVEAQFSIPFTVATAWIDGPITLGHLSDEGIKRPELLDLCKRVQCYVHDGIDKEWARFVTPADVMVEFKDGTSAHCRVDYPKGHPNNAMTEAEFAAKAVDCAKLSAVPLKPDTVPRLIECVATLDKAKDITSLMRIMTAQ
jgi:2-methylcitrate dehydratase PrpD